MAPTWDTVTGPIGIGSHVLWWARPHVAHLGVVLAADPDTGHPVVAAAGHYGPRTRTVPPAALHHTHAPPTCNL